MNNEHLQGVRLCGCKMLLGPSWVLLGGLLEASWALLGASWGLLGLLGRLLGGSWGLSEATWGPRGELPGASWEPPGASCGGWGWGWGLCRSPRSPRTPQEAFRTPQVTNITSIQSFCRETTRHSQTAPRHLQDTSKYYNSFKLLFLLIYSCCLKKPSQFQDARYSLARSSQATHCKLP